MYEVKPKTNFCSRMDIQEEQLSFFDFILSLIQSAYSSPPQFFRHPGSCSVQQGAAEGVKPNPLTPPPTPSPNP